MHATNRRHRPIWELRHAFALCKEGAILLTNLLLRNVNLPQQVKLILVETSFEAEQKSIVAMTRRIDRFLIDSTASVVRRNTIGGLARIRSSGSIGKSGMAS